MREIKFRAWDTIELKIIKIDSVDYEAGSEYFTDERYILLQFTGLKDKNGKEIYEGYIVKVESFVTSVEFGAGWFCYDPLEEGDRRHALFLINEKCEIIGNIYENPELIDSVLVEGDHE